MSGKRERLLASARRLCHSLADAEDAVQEALLRTAMSDSLDEHRVDQYLHTTLRRIVIDGYRDQQKQRRISAEAVLRPEPTGSPEERMCEQAEAANSANLVREQLSSREHDIASRRAEGHSTHVIAADLKVSVKAVESILGRVRVRLRKDGWS